MDTISFILAILAIALFSVEGYMRKSLVAWGLAAISLSYVVAQVWESSSAVKL